MKTAERERAMQIIVEIVRQAGGVLDNKTNLFKAFWLSHVHVLRDTGKPLSEWPIVRMPRGPGIHDFDRLLGQLLADGAIETETISVGNYTAFRFRLTGSTEQVDAHSAEIIRNATLAVQGMTAAAASDWSHENSRSWQNSKDGEELDIVLDSMSEERFRDRVNSMKKTRSEIETALS